MFSRNVYDFTRNEISVYVWHGGEIDDFSERKKNAFDSFGETALF